MDAKEISNYVWPETTLDLDANAPCMLLHTIYRATGGCDSTGERTTLLSLLYCIDAGAVGRYSSPTALALPGHPLRDALTAFAGTYAEVEASGTNRARWCGAIFG